MVAEICNDKYVLKVLIWGKVLGFCFEEKFQSVKNLGRN